MGRTGRWSGLAGFDSARKGRGLKGVNVCSLTSFLVRIVALCLLSKKVSLMKSVFCSFVTNNDST